MTYMKQGRFSYEPVRRPGTRARFGVPGGGPRGGMGDIGFTRWSLGGIMDFLDPFGILKQYDPTKPPDTTKSTSQDQTIKCLGQANTQAADLDAQIQTIATDWRPTGFYTPDQIRTIVNGVFSTFPDVQQALASAPNSTSDAAQMTKERLDNLQDSIPQGQAYLKAADDAPSSGSQVISAPGLKRWVYTSLGRVSDGYVHAAMLYCEQSYLERGLAVIQAVWAVIKKIAGVVAEVGKKIYNAAEGAFNLTMWLAKYSPLLAVGGVAIWLAMRQRKKAAQVSP